MKKKNESRAESSAGAGIGQSQKGTVFNPKEYKIVAMRECVPVNEQNVCDNPPSVWEYWQANIPTHPFFNPECECFAALLLNTRRRAKGHVLISVGLLDTMLVHPRETFRAAIIAAASAIVLMHNHPSGDPSPSLADVKVTRELIKAGQIIKIEVLDHVIAGAGRYVSLRQLGYFNPQPEVIPKPWPARIRFERTGIATVKT